MKTVLMLIFAAFLSLSFLGCDGEAEDAGESVDEAMQDAGDNIQDAADDAGDAMEDACDEVTDNNC